MINVRKWFQFALSLTLIAIAASSAAAPQKQFTLTLSQAGPLRVAAKLTNTSPNGNSSFNSFDLDLGGFMPSGPVTLVHSATSSPSFTADLTSVPGHVRISNLTPVGRTEFVVVTFGLQSTCPSSGNATVDATVWTGSNFSGELFNDLSGVQSVSAGCDTVIASCAPPANVYNEPPSPSGNVTSIERLPNKDGSACQPIAFNVTFLDGDRTVFVQWDEVTFPNVVLRATVSWPVELTETATSFPKRTQVAWEELSPGVPKYTLAPACASDVPPTTTNTTMPIVNYAPYTGQKVRACLVEEAFKAQSASSVPAPSPACPAPTSAAVGCILVDSVFYITGDPWLSRQ